MKKAQVNHISCTSEIELKKKTTVTAEDILYVQMSFS